MHDVFLHGFFFALQYFTQDADTQDHPIPCDKMFKPNLRRSTKLKVGWCDGEPSRRWWDGVLCHRIS